MTPKRDLNLLWTYLVKTAQGSKGKRTRIQIECPDIIKKPPGDPATEDEELGTDHCYGMVATRAGSGTVDHDAGPLPRY